MRFRQGQAVEIIGPPESPYIGKIGSIQGKRSYQMGIEGYEVWIDGTLEIFSASYLVPYKGGK